MQELVSQPYLLIQGKHNLNATVEALNVVGYSIPTMNAIGGAIKTEPHQPSAGP
jgi:hypothetical protein